MSTAPQIAPTPGPHPGGRRLADQLGLHELEIASRKALLGLDAEDAIVLRRVLPRIERQVDGLVEAFYRQQLAVDAIAVLISDADTLERLAGAQRRYVLELFSGRYDTEYVRGRLRIGQMHKRIGVAPKLYLSAMLRLRNLLRDLIVAELPRREQHAPVLDALDKVMNFDTQLVFDTYIHALVSEVEASHRQVVDYAYSLEQQVAERTREVEQLSHTDPLTGLYNRRALDAFVVRDLANAKRAKSRLALLYIDIDGFKSLNDSQGHLRGDGVLEDIGRVLREHMRQGDLACRLGGDEFCVLMIGAAEPAALSFARRLQRICTEVLPATLTLSIGIALTGPPRFAEFADLMGQADQAMYQAKRHRGYAIQVFAPESGSGTPGAG